MAETSKPAVSVLLAAYYSQATIGGTLDSLRRQSYRDFEVIVVNSSPEGETAALVRGHYPEAVFIQNPYRLYPHAARNVGAAHARGELLVFSDADVEMRSDWLEQLVLAWRAGAEAGVGAMELARETWWERGVHLAKFHDLLPGTEGATRWIAPTANAFYGRRVWEEVGPFPEEGFSGDAVMSWMAARAGYQPRFVPGAVVEHSHEGNWGQLIAQRVSRGREFVAVRAASEGWGRTKLLAYALAFPVLPLIVMARAFGSARRAERLTAFFATLPVQAAAHWAWSAGEAIGAFRALWSRARA